MTFGKVKLKFSSIIKVQCRPNICFFFHLLLSAKKKFGTMTKARITALGIIGFSCFYFDLWLWAQRVAPRFFILHMLSAIRSNLLWSLSYSELWNKRTPWNNRSTILILINLGIAVIFIYLFFLQIFSKLLSVLPLCLFLSLE